MLIRGVVLQVLRQVYVDHQNIDDQLVRSIALPANDSNASEIFYRVITGWSGVGVPVNELLSKLQVLLASWPVAVGRRRGLCLTCAKAVVGRSGCWGMRVCQQAQISCYGHWQLCACQL